MNAKRRLPVLQAPANDDVPDRPPWQWSVFGAGLIVLLWVVLTVLTAPLAGLAGGSRPRTVLFAIVTQGVASLLVGLVIGTWTKQRGIKEAAVAGALSAVFAMTCGVLAAITSGAAGWADIAVSVAGGGVLVPSATASAALGAWIGSRKKRVLQGP
jgi:hypothetical protein